jgi:hypothetical protein
MRTAPKEVLTIPKKLSRKSFVRGHQNRVDGALAVAIFLCPPPGATLWVVTKMGINKEPLIHDPRMGTMCPIHIFQKRSIVL